MTYSICIKCQAKALVLETRRKPDGTVRRRYECAKGHRFSTEEWPAERVEALQAIEQAALVLRTSSWRHEAKAA